MNRVFLYELRRQMVNRFFVGILTVCLFYAWMTLKTEVIQGVANTAPFSAWSFGYYMCQNMPLLVIALLFGFWNIFSPTARRVEVLTSATPVDEKIYNLLKCGAVLISWLVILLCTILLGLIFMIRIFGDAVSVSELLISCTVTVLPALLYFFGVGVFAGQLKLWQTVVVTILAFLASLLPFTDYATLLGTSLFTEYPLTLEVLDPVFSLPHTAVFGRIIFAFVGALLIALSVSRSGNRQKNG